MHTCVCEGVCVWCDRAAPIRLSAPPHSSVHFCVVLYLVWQGTWHTSFNRQLTKEMQDAAWGGKATELVALIHAGTCHIDAKDSVRMRHRCIDTTRAEHVRRIFPFLCFFQLCYFMCRIIIMYTRMRNYVHVHVCAHVCMRF